MMCKRFIEGYYKLQNRKYKYYRELDELICICYIICNRAIPMPKDEQMKIKSGYITLIDNNLDGGYDVACVTSYEQYVVYIRGRNIIIAIMILPSN